MKVHICNQCEAPMKNNSGVLRRTCKCKKTDYREVEVPDYEMIFPLPRMVPVVDIDVGEVEPRQKGPQNVLRELPASAAERKQLPITSGVLDYFPLAIAEVARVSKAGNDQHNPGQPLHWARGKSSDHADCIARHLIQRGTYDTSDPVPQRHSAKLAWRALALLQEELEAEAGFDPKEGL